MRIKQTREVFQERLVELFRQDDLIGDGEVAKMYAEMSGLRRNPGHRAF